MSFCSLLGIPSSPSLSHPIVTMGTKGCTLDRQMSTSHSDQFLIVKNKGNPQQQTSIHDSTHGHLGKLRSRDSLKDSIILRHTVTHFIQGSEPSISCTVPPASTLLLPPQNKRLYSKTKLLTEISVHKDGRVVPKAAACSCSNMACSRGQKKS